MIRNIRADLLQASSNFGVQSAITEVETALWRGMVGENVNTVDGRQMNRLGGADCWQVCRMSRAGSQE